MNAPASRLLVALLATSTVAVATPKKPTVKPAALSKGDAEIKAMVAAYAKVGDFTLTCDDSLTNGKERFTVHSTISMAADGRKSIQATAHNAAATPPDMSAAALYDGKQLRKKLAGRPERVLTASQLKQEPLQLPNFFIGSVGAKVLGSLLKPLKVADDMGTDRVGAPVFYDLGGGKTSVDLHFKRKRGASPKLVQEQTVVLYLGADKFLQRVELKESKVGGHGMEFYANSYLTRPMPLDSLTAFNWEMLSTREPEIVGQAGEIPPVVPESGSIPSPTKVPVPVDSGQ